MPERTYTGFAPRGAVEIVDRDGRIIRTVPFVRGEPIEVTAEEAEFLDQSPDWGGVPVDDDLTGLDKDALLAVADAEQVEVSKRWGVDRLTETIREHRIAKTAEVDESEEDTDNG